MMPAGRLTIAVIGDEDLVNLLRLAGVKRYYQIEDGPTVQEDVRNALNEAVSDSSVSIIAMLEDYMGYAQDIIDKVEANKRLTPVFLGLPKKPGTSAGDVAAYYRDFVRKFVGFEIEI